MHKIERTVVSQLIQDLQELVEYSTAAKPISPVMYAAPYQSVRIVVTLHIDCNQLTNLEYINEKGNTSERVHNIVCVRTFVENTINKYALLLRLNEARLLFNGPSCSLELSDDCG
jgi:hypothetical protein